MVTIAASRVWVLSTLRWLLWMSYNPIAGKWPLQTRLHFLQRGGVPVPLPRSRAPPGGTRGCTTSGSSRTGVTVTVRNQTQRAPPSTGTSEGTGWTLSSGTTCVLWCSPRQSDIDRCIGGWTWPFWGWWFGSAATFWAKWWLCFPGPRRVCRDPAGGAVTCDAIVSKNHCHLAWESVASLPGL